MLTCSQGPLAKESSAKAHGKAWALQLDREHTVSQHNQLGYPFLGTRPLSVTGYESLLALDDLHEPTRSLVSEVHKVSLCDFHEAQDCYPLKSAHCGHWQIS